MKTTSSQWTVRVPDAVSTTVSVLLFGVALSPLAAAQPAGPGGANCTALPRVGPGPSCAASIERGGSVCEWTGECGAVDGAECSNKCIASLAPLSSIANVQTGSLQAPGITYCHLLGSYLNQAWPVVQQAANDPPETIVYNSTSSSNTTTRQPAPAGLTGAVDGGIPDANPTDTSASAFTAPTSAAPQRRLQQDAIPQAPAASPAAAGPPEGCPTDEMIDTIVASPAWASIVRAPQDILDRSNIRDRVSLFGSLTSADALKAFFNNACKTELVEPPLSALFPTAAPPPPGTCPGDVALQPRTVCRDAAGLLEAAYGDFTTAPTLTEFLSTAAADMQQACAAARSAAPTAPCAPSVWLMDPACSQRMLDLLGTPLPDSVVTNAALRTVSGAYLALHDACSKLTTKEECFSSPFPQLLQAATQAASAVLPDMRNPANPNPATPTVRTAPDAPAAAPGAAAVPPPGSGAESGAEAVAAAPATVLGGVPAPPTVAEAAAAAMPVQAWVAAAVAAAVALFGIAW
eukprot:jgi/Ulvmu1/3498/UM162_0005.1